MTVERKHSVTLLRFSVSILLVGHLLAVVLPPLSFQTRGPIGQSPSIATIIAPLEGYSQFLYIDRGYAFFAPEPGPSHLVQVAVSESDGRVAETMIPDREVHWPRLLYHRHFMLTEFLDRIYQPLGPPPELVEADPEQAEYWMRMRARYEHVRQSVVEHLEHEYPGRDVAIRRIEHLIPDVIDYRLEPVSLTHPDSYRVMLDQPIQEEPSAILAAPANPAETIPPALPSTLEPAGDSENPSQRPEESETRTDDTQVGDETLDATPKGTANQAVESSATDAQEDSA
jgi:hypothetical protein